MKNFSLESFVQGWIISAIVLILILLAVLPKDCRAAEWDNTDRALFGTFVGLQVADGLQTHYAVKHPEQFREANPLLGSEPSDAKIILFKSAAVGIVYWATRDANPATRKTVLGILDVMYIGVVAHNASIGVRVGF